MNRAHLLPRTPLPPGASPPPPFNKIKFIIHGSILLKFEAEHFHMFANNN